MNITAIIIAVAERMKMTATTPPTMAPTMAAVLPLNKAIKRRY